jgi:hypothetical protein
VVSIAVVVGRVGVVMEWFGLVWFFQKISEPQTEP